MNALAKESPREAGEKNNGVMKMSGESIAQ